MKIILMLAVLVTLSACATTVLVENKTCKSKLADGNGNPVISECKKVEL